MGSWYSRGAGLLMGSSTVDRMSRDSGLCGDCSWNRTGCFPLAVAFSSSARSSSSMFWISVAILWARFRMGGRPTPCSSSTLINSLRNASCTPSNWTSVHPSKSSHSDRRREVVVDSFHHPSCEVSCNLFVCWTTKRVHFLFPDIQIHISLPYSQWDLAPFLNEVVVRQ